MNAGPRGGDTSSTARWGPELAVAVELVESAGRLVAARYEDSGPVAYKGAHDIVT